MAFRQRSNIRSKKRFTKEDEEDEDDAEAIKRLAESASKSNTKKKEKMVQSSKLSFGDDDEEVVYAVKKSKSRGLAVQGVAPGNDAPTGASYSKDDLAQLKKNTQQMPQAFISNGSVKSELAASENGAVLKISGSFVAKQTSEADARASAMPGSLKTLPISVAPASKMPLPPPPRPNTLPPQKARGPRWDRDRPEPTASTSTAAENGHSGSPRAAAALSGKHPPSTSGKSGGDEDDDDDSDFPDARMIQLAKQKRERLRHAHIAPDYVPSESGVFKSVSEFKRLEDAVRKGSDDEVSDDEAEEDMRIRFSATTMRPEKKAPVTLHDLNARSGSESDDDEFASAQQRRAMANAATSLQQRVSGAIARNAEGGRDAVAVARAAPGGGLVGEGTAGADGPAVSAADRGARALKALEQHVARLQQRSSRLKADLAKTDTRIHDAVAAIGAQEAAFAALSERYQYLQTLRAFLRDLCECLQHKAADVEALEEERGALTTQRADALRAQRRSTRQEVFAPAAAAVQALDSFGPGVTQQRAVELAEVAAQRSEEFALDQSCVRKLDEFGRDENAYQREQAKARQAQRRAAFAELQARASGGSSAELLNDEALLRAAGAGGPSELDESYYRRKVAEVGEIVKGVLKDVHEDFATLPAVAAKLAEFRTRFPAAYQQAYISDSLPALLSVYVRCELLLYDPIHANGEPDRQSAAAGVCSFMEHDWFRVLCDFGGEGGPDEDLVPVVVSKVVLDGKVRGLLQAAWDPTDAEQSRAVRDTVNDLLAFSTDKSAADFARLVELIKQRLIDAIDDFEAVPAWPPSRIASSARVAAAAAVAWRDALAFLASICSFNKLLSPQLLQELALKRLLAGRITPALQVAAAEAGGGDAFAIQLAVARLRQLLAALPPDWLKTKIAELEPVRLAASLALSKSGTVKSCQEDVAAVRRLLSLK